ncbi:MAG: DUF456 domain-containing protein [Flavobacterium sp.]
MLTLTLLVLAFILIIFGILGSILPALPGPPLAWAGLLLFFFIPGIEMSYWLLGITLFFTLVVSILDYVIPAKGTKKFGGSSYGVWGTNIGLVVGLFLPPFGFLIGPFLGAFIGEIYHNANNPKGAIKAAVGSFVGFLASTFMKVFFCMILFGILLYKTIQNWGLLTGNVFGN